jgi:UDP-glucose:(heptosyl)LPS alpha-1,3-glucosyltransferase
MKLAFCLFNYFPYGGLQRDFFKIAQVCKNRGYQITIYTMKWDAEIPSWANLKIIPVCGFTNHSRAICFVNKTKKLLAKENYDAVIGFNKMPSLDFYFAGDVCFKTKLQKKSFLSFLPRYKSFLNLEKAVFNKTSKTQILSLTVDQKETFQQAYKTPSERFHLIPPGIAKNNYSPDEMQKLRDEIRQSLQIENNEPLFLLVASQFHNKGLDRALYALSSLNDNQVQLIVIGDGKKTFYEKLSKKLNILNQVKFLGARSSLLEYMIASDILLHPARVEAAGMVLVEALTAGLPVLTTKPCGYATHVQAANAGIILAEPFNQLQLNKALSKILAGDNKKLQKNALDYAKKTNLYGMANKTVNLIELLNAPKFK